MWRARWDPGVLKAEALALLPCGLGMAFSQPHAMAARRHQHGRLVVEVDEYSPNPTQAFTFYNINQGRFQPPHVQMVDPVPHDAPKPPGYTRFVCVSDTHSRTDPVQMPYGDVLIHAGDFTELGLPSEVKKFNEWLAQPRQPPSDGKGRRTTPVVWAHSRVPLDLRERLSERLRSTAWSLAACSERWKAAEGPA
ncbi:PREDICTED: metallophosphoesterase domain-containing protein 1 [Condylura cristata]|uniref:metallophosphoesterase domain-containing protein 1 n=1 Tax=Condylura cristata TaxID=143302 RepID=UPI0006438406|nr:PREDICTED: metallophosphoesterase domain-containing protein 1 [Condylura cristata]